MDDFKCKEKEIYQVFLLCTVFKMPVFSSPSTSALCPADPDSGVKPLWNLKAGSPFISDAVGLRKH